MSLVPKLQTYAICTIVNQNVDYGSGDKSASKVNFLCVQSIQKCTDCFKSQNPFLTACHIGDSELMLYYYSKNHKVINGFYDEISKMNSMHLAALSGDVNAISLVYYLKKDLIRSFDSNGRSPLIFAIMKGNLRAVLKIIEMEPSLLDKLDNLGLNPMHYAVEYFDDAILKKLYELRPSLATNPNCFRITPLFYAVLSSGDMQSPKQDEKLEKAVETLFKLDQNLLISEELGCSALSFAAQHKKYKMVKKIFELNPKLLEHVDRGGFKILDIAYLTMDNEMIAIVEELIPG